MISDSEFKSQSKEEKYPLLFGEFSKVDEPTQEAVQPPQMAQEAQEHQVLEVLEDILTEVKETLQPERGEISPRPLSPSLTQQPVEFHSRSVRHQNWIEVIKEPLFKLQDLNQA